jgi:hypothetical protein
VGFSLNSGRRLLDVCVVVERRGIWDFKKCTFEIAWLYRGLE